MVSNSSSLTRQGMLEKKHKSLSIIQQCTLLSISRSTVYYKTRRKLRDDELMIKSEIERKFLSFPFYGIRRMKVHLSQLGYQINEKRVRRYYKDLRICCIYPKPRMTTRNKEHKIHPYLLRDLAITHCNQVWSSDITYISTPKGWMYLCAIIDWYSRDVLAWELSNTHDSEFCQSVLRTALKKYGKPEIFNTDQGSEFTANNYTKILLDKGIKISMDGVGRALDNIFIERFWRTVKYEYIYIQHPQTGQELYAGLNKYLSWYNNERPHQLLGYKTPNQVRMVA